jgi:glycosyltransferase involved in cell wall biosynthesis
MRVSLAVFGVFHHFELAHQLRQHGRLQTVYSTYPWFRLKREGLPHKYVETFPWYHTGVSALARYGLYPSPWTETLDWWNGLAFDAWIKRRIPPTDVLIAISGAALDAGKLVQARGGKYICDRGSTHARYQGRILEEEFGLWKQTIETHDLRDTEREEQQYEQADCITVPSHFVARSFVAEGVAPGKLQIIPYGVRLDTFHPTGSPGAGTFEVVFAGQVGFRKGIPYLLEAFARLRHPRKRLRIAGAVQSEIRPLLSQWPLEQVEFLGQVPHNQLAQYFSSSHALVLPSIEEGLALVQAEAMACGCPVIATTNTGAEDLFTDGKEGFIVPIRDPQAIADRMQQLADDPQLQQQMSAAALERVQFLGGWKDYGDRWVRLLDELCGQAPVQTSV